MKVLWFTNTPSNAAAEFGFQGFGGGWISSLESLFVESRVCQLFLCFFYDGQAFKKLEKGTVTYYGIPLNRSNALKRVISRHLVQLNDDNSSISFNQILNEVNPDLIHVFGTENSYGKFLPDKYDKVLFHLQGLAMPYSQVFLPLGINKWTIFKNSSLTSILRGTTLNDEFNLFRKRGLREVNIIKRWNYFIGRTSWDNNYINLLNPKAEYFHCDELLRKEFYNTQWINPNIPNENHTIILGTTISPNLLKGLDLIYKVSGLLNEYKIVWKIFGTSEDDSVNKFILKISKLSNKPPNVRFYGNINANQLIEQLLACHFFVHTSYIDNSPNSVCEAQILGLPVISSSVGGIKTLIEDGKTGFLFNPYDRYDLAGLLLSLINNYKYAIEVGKNARTIAIQRHSPDKIMKELLEIYNSILLH
mgnify:CR=1 FL=1